MDSDEETKIFSYTPLKRQKLGCNETITSSQISCSKTSRSLSNKSKHFLQRKRNGNPSQITQSSNTQVTNMSQSIKNSSLSFKKPHSKIAKNCLNNSEKLNLDKRSHSSLLDESKPSKSLFEAPKDTQLTQITNLFEDDTPDIDLTEVINSNSSDISCPEASHSLLINESHGTNINMNLHLPNKNNMQIYSDIDITDEVLPVGGSNIQNKISSDEAINEDESDFENVVSPVQATLGKVNSWLQSSLNYLTPKKVEVIKRKETSECLNHHNKNSPINLEVSDLDSKACIHLHFHVNSPQKFIQPTIDQFFKKNKPENVAQNNNIENTKVYNGNDVIKTWESIMNSKRKNDCIASTSRATSSENNETIANSSHNGNVNARKITSNNISTGNKLCPFYKRIEDTSFVVDAFTYGDIKGVSAYFLSHFHYDHYRGLSKKFKNIIYCSQITANLVRLKLNVEENFLRPLPLEEPRIINGVEVTLYDSNHCPGAVMFLFRLTSGKTILHVGDFRAHPIMENISALWNSLVNVLYLDTTYLDPSYNFRGQEEILEKCVSIAKEHAKFTKKTLFLVGSYTIGKEKVFKSIASALDCKVFAPSYKERVLKCLEDNEISDRLTRNKHDAKVHVVPMSEITPIKLGKYMQVMQNTFNVLVAIKPTGWEHNSSTCHDLVSLRPKQIGNIYIYGIPYSEHSSYSELKRFVQFVQPEKIIPTVNIENAASRTKMNNILQRWQRESKEAFGK